jgi:hypothetical protein
MTLLGYGEVRFEQHEEGLRIYLPAENPNTGNYPYALKLEFDGKIPEFKYTNPR